MLFHNQHAKNVLSRIQASEKHKPTLQTKASKGPNTEICMLEWPRPQIQIIGSPPIKEQ